MFRKSYRKLLRWNDEFPFAKFCVSEDERPLLAVEVPIADADADRWASRSPGSSAIADQLLDESKDWIWIGGRMPDQSGRTPRNPAFLARYAGRLPELPDADETRSRRRRLARVLLALVVALGLLAAPGVAAGRRGRGPPRRT